MGSWIHYERAGDNSVMVALVQRINSAWTLYKGWIAGSQYEVAYGEVQLYVTSSSEKISRQNFFSHTVITFCHHSLFNYLGREHRVAKYYKFVAQLDSKWIHDSVDKILKPISNWFRKLLYGEVFLSINTRNTKRSF